MTKRKNSRRADPTKAQKKSATKHGTCSNTNQPLMVVCAVCVSFAPIATRRMIFLIFRQEIKKTGADTAAADHSAIAISTPALTQYIGIAHWQTIWICMGIVPCGKTYTRLFSPSRSLSCLTDFPFSRQCDKSRNIRIGNINFFPCGF